MIHFHETAGKLNQTQVTVTHPQGLGLLEKRGGILMPFLRNQLWRLAGHLFTDEATLKVQFKCTRVQPAMWGNIAAI